MRDILLFIILMGIFSYMIDISYNEKIKNKGNFNLNLLLLLHGFLMIYKKMFKEKSESEYKNEKSFTNYILLPVLIMISFYKIHKLTSK